MDSSVGSAIHQILLQEQAEGAKLQEKREYEAAVSAGERSVRDELAASCRIQNKLEAIIRTSVEVAAQLEIAKIRSQARAQQLDVVRKNIEELKTRVEKDVSGVWEERGQLCAATLSLAEHCGISALLATRARAELAPRPAPLAPPQPPAPLETAAQRLQAAEQRRDSLLAEKVILKVVPEHEEEFVRLRNALRFCREITSTILNTSSEVPPRG